MRGSTPRCFRQFRTRVVEHGLEQRVLDLLLAALVEQGLVTAGGRQRTDSTHVISAVRDLNRLELAGESVRACVEALSAVAPDWLGAVIDVAGWSRRYGARIDTWRLPTVPGKRAELVRPTAPTRGCCYARSATRRPRRGCGNYPPSRCCAWCCCRTTSSPPTPRGGR